MIEIRHKKTGAVLLRVDGETLAGADLCRAELREADLRGADLRDAQLWQANLLQADLAGADLCGALLLGAVLWGADLTDVCWDHRTFWPYDLDATRLPAPVTDHRARRKAGAVLLHQRTARCRKGLHPVEPGWPSCPSCLQTLWEDAARARRRSKAACSRSKRLRLCSAEACDRAQAVWQDVLRRHAAWWASEEACRRGSPSAG